jgi:hypothetical protein
MRGRLNEDVYKFYETDIHDGELPDVRLVDGSRPAPLGEPAHPWELQVPYSIPADLVILDAFDQFVWYVYYSSLRRVSVDFPSDDPLF